MTTASRLQRAVQEFNFRNLDPYLVLGTASDRYAGWIGMVYTAERYQGRTTSRSKRLGGKTYAEKVLPIDSVTEYFEHFQMLEIDFTYYRALLDHRQKPTPNYRLLETYRSYLGVDDAILLKVPQQICAGSILRSGRSIPNPDYLNPEMFVHQFYNPAVRLLGKHLQGFIFEQEYHRKHDRTTTDENARQWEAFWDQIPRDHRYHLELRTGAYLTKTLFSVLETYGVGQVLSHWTWLPPLVKQYHRSGGRFLNSGKVCIVRLLTPLLMRYADTYRTAFPFNRLVEDMLQPQMIEETVELIEAAAAQNVKAHVVVNNRAGGSAPIVAQRVAESWLERRQSALGDDQAS